MKRKIKNIMLNENGLRLIKIERVKESESALF